MIYILIVALLLILGMGYHIIDCHSDIEYHKNMSEFYQRWRAKEHDSHMESLDKIISLEKEVRKLKEAIWDSSLCEEKLQELRTEYLKQMTYSEKDELEERSYGDDNK